MRRTSKISDDPDHFEAGRDSRPRRRVLFVLGFTAAFALEP
jgi:hypothetical protein